MSEDMENIMRILLAVEDKLFGEAIAEFAARHQWPEQSEFRVLHVVEPVFNVVPPAQADSSANYIEEKFRAGKSLVLSVGTRIRQALPTVPLTEEVAEGNPKDVILETATSWNADLVMIGSHGRTGIGKLLLGSVSLSILNSAPCSVILIKLPAAEPQTAPLENGKAVTHAENP